MARDFSECPDPENFEPYEIQATGKRYMARKNGCLFCESCTDIFCDATNGIYMIICDKELNTDVGMSGECGWFKRVEQ